MALAWNPAATGPGGQATLNDYLKGNIPIPQSGSVSRGEGGQGYAYEDVAKRLAGAGAGSTTASSEALNKLLADPTSNPGYRASLQGVLASMRPGVEQGYQDLQDAFKAAGAEQSGAYGNTLAKYAGEVNRNETIAASDVLSKLLPTLVSGYSSQASQTPSLLEALKLSKQSNLTVNQGGGAGAGGGQSGVRPVFGTGQYSNLSNAPGVASKDQIWGY